MKKSSSHTPIYRKNASGIFVQTGRMSNLLQQDVSTFLAIKQQALKLQESYSQNGLVLPSTSYLSKLLDDAVMLSDAWLLNDHSHITPQHIFNVCQLSRVTAAAAHLGVSEQARKYLSALLLSFA